MLGKEVQNTGGITARLKNLTTHVVFIGKNSFMEKENSVTENKTLPVDCGEVTLVERPLGLVEARSPDLRGGSHQVYNFYLF